MSPWQVLSPEQVTSQRPVPQVVWLVHEPLSQVIAQSPSAGQSISPVQLRSPVHPIVHSIPSLQSILLSQESRLLQSVTQCHPAGHLQPWSQLSRQVSSAQLLVQTLGHVLASSPGVASAPLWRSRPPSGSSNSSGHSRQPSAGKTSSRSILELRIPRTPPAAPAPHRYP
jgi:hypothetical protein